MVKNLFKPAGVIFFALLMVHITGMTPRLAAQDTSEKRVFPPAANYSVKKAVSKIRIDGVLDEEAWKQSEKIKIFNEFLPGDNVPAPVESEVLVTFDKSNLYVAFRCFDPEPAKIRAHLMDRDAIDTFVQDDHVSFMVDTFNDERRGFQFRINPLGVQADAIFSELEGYEDFSWDAIWKSSGKLTDSGYIVEVAIPFNQLRFPKGKGVQTWGFGASRSWPRNVRHRMITYYQDRNKSCILCQKNKITGFEGISPGKNIELDPTLTAARTDTRTDFPSGGIEKGKVKVEPGISARWGVTPNLTLNATINPDYSQIEADVAQLEVNTRFVLRYPEKRPFFLEGADFFLTPIEAVFTRTVHDPVWGAKTSGKSGKNALGLFVTQDRYNNLIFPSNQGSAITSLDEDVYNGVFRYRRDVGKGSALGVLYTGRAGNDYFNHVAGVDGYFRFTRSKIMSAQYLYSRTDYPDPVALSYGQETEAFDGSALYARFAHMGRNLRYWVQYEDLSPGFRSDSGFVPRVDFKRLEAAYHPVVWGKKGSWFDRLGFMIRGVNITDHNNNLTDRDISLIASYTGPLQSYSEVAFSRIKEFYNGVTYDKSSAYWYITMKPASGVSLSLVTIAEDAIDYANSRKAKSLYLSPRFELGLGRHLNLNVRHNFQRLSLDGEKIFTVHLLQTRLVYNINIRTFVRAIVQYYDISRNTALYLEPVGPATRTLFTQFLFSYKINPQTVLFIGYSDNYMGFKGIDITRTNRTFFLKLGYALVM